MADDIKDPAKDIKSAPPQEVNVDEIEISVLMLVKNVRAHEAAANFLSRRGWPTQAASNLQKAVKILSTEKPDFVLVSVNFPHPSITKLAPLFAQTFKVETVWFSETMDASSLAQIAKLKGNKITGGASGPNLQRTLRRILQAKLNPTLANEKQDDDMNSSPEGRSNTVTVRGDQSKDNGSFEFTQTQVGSEKLDAGKYTLETQSLPSKRKKLKDLSIASSVNHSDSSEASSVESVGSEQDLMKMINALASGEAVDNSVEKSGTPEVPFSNDISSSAEFAKSNLIDISNSDIAPDFDTAFEKTKSGTSINNLSGNDESKNHQSSSIEHAGIQGQSSQLLTQEGVQGQYGKYDPLFAAVHYAVDKISHGQKINWTGVEPTNDIFVIPVDHDDVHGYLVVKFEEQSKENRIAFFELLRTMVAESVEEQTSLNVESGFDIGVPELHFGNWLKSTATFSLASEYNGSPFCVAFFKTQNALPKIKSEGERDMLSVSVNDISTEHPLTFKGYLKLDKNKKFYLYIKNGRYLLPEQKERLSEANIKEICVKKIDEANLKKFIAFSQLRESMLEALKLAS